MGAAPSLTGKSVLVTGGGRGLGRAMALGLTDAGADVYVAAHIPDDISALQAEADARDAPGSLHARLADLRDAAVCAEVVAEARARFGGLDGLINNAGLTFTYFSPNRFARERAKPFWEHPDSVVADVIEVNFLVADRMARLVVPHMIAAAAGRIVNVTTMIETMTRPGASPYGPSKAALETASEIWVKDLDGTGVAVNILNPGAAADTEGFEVAEYREHAKTKVHRVVAAEKMAAPAVWLMSDAAAGVTGMRYDAADWDAEADQDGEAARIGRPLGFRLKERG